MKLYKYFLLLFAFIVACNDTPVVHNGVEHTLESFRVEPGVSWFDLHYQEYQPIDSLCNLIEDKYDANEYNLVMFTTYLCDCNDNSTYLSKIAKIYNSCGIPESNITIYLMTSKDDETPYKGDVVIDKFPEAYLFKNGQPVASLISTRDKLEDNVQSFEKAILDLISQ